jgi:hypothetical protein
MANNAGERFLEILKKLEEEEKQRKDIVAPVNSLRMNEDFTFTSDNLGKVEMTDHAFGQLCQNIYNYAIPADYFRNLYKENPEKATADFNYHLENGRGTERKFRITGSQVRGIVSESYVPYDNLDALTIFMDTAKELPNYELMTYHMDERLMFMRFTFPSTGKSFGQSVDGQDDRNFVALDLVNSEVGFTSIIANPSVFRLVCTNGLVAKQAEYGFFKQRHAHFDPAVVNERLKKSIVHGVEMGQDILTKFESARKVRIENPYEMITEYGKRKALSEKMIRTVRANFDVEAESSLFGVVNSFTRTARDIKNLERRLDLEKYASKIMDDGLKVRA